MTDLIPPNPAAPETPHSPDRRSLVPELAGRDLAEQYVGECPKPWTTAGEWEHRVWMTIKTPAVLSAEIALPMAATGAALGAGFGLVFGPPGVAGGAVSGGLIWGVPALIGTVGFGTMAGVAEGIADVADRRQLVESCNMDKKRWAETPKSDLLKVMEYEKKHPDPSHTNYMSYKF